MTEEPWEISGPILFRIWVTRGCYFVLSDRLKRKARYSTASITFLSFYVLIISIIPIVYGTQISEAYKTGISVTTIVLSVFIIIITLLETSKEYRLEAEYAQRTAQNLEELYIKFENKDLSAHPKDDDKLRVQYCDVLGSVRATRRSIDYIWFQLTNRAAFNIQFWTAVRLVLALGWTALLEYWIYAAMILAPPLLASKFMS